jgi:hypothetical protein
VGEDPGREEIDLFFLGRAAYSIERIVDPGQRCAVTITGTEYHQIASDFNQ